MRNTKFVFGSLLIALSACSNYSLDKNERQLGDMQSTLEQIKMQEGGAKDELDSIFLASYEAITSDKNADTAQVARANKLLGQYTAFKIEKAIDSFSQDMEKYMKAIKGFSEGFSSELEK